MPRKLLRGFSIAGTSSNYWWIFKPWSWLPGSENGAPMQPWHLYKMLNRDLIPFFLVPDTEECKENRGNAIIHEIIFYEDWLFPPQKPWSAGRCRKLGPPISPWPQPPSIFKEASDLKAWPPMATDNRTALPKRAPRPASHAGHFAVSLVPFVACC